MNEIAVNDQEALVPEIITLESFDDIKKRYEKIKANLTDRITLNFAQCKRIQSSGLKALVAFSEELEKDQKYVYIDNMSNDIFKALKITGKQGLFRFLHQGEYISNRFASGPNRC